MTTPAMSDAWLALVFIIPTALMGAIGYFVEGCRDELRAIRLLLAKRERKP